MSILILHTAHLCHYCFTRMKLLSVAAVLLSVLALSFAKNEWYEGDDFIAQRDLHLDIGSGFEFKDLVSNQPFIYFFWPAVGIAVFCLLCGLIGWCCCCYMWCNRPYRKEPKIYTTKIEEIFYEKENVELVSVVADDSSKLVSKSTREGDSEEKVEDVKLEIMAEVRDVKKEEMEVVKPESDVPVVYVPMETNNKQEGIQPAVSNEEERKGDKQKAEELEVKKTDLHKPSTPLVQQPLSLDVLPTLDMTDLDLALQSLNIDAQLISLRSDDVNEEPLTVGTGFAADPVDDMFKNLLESQYYKEDSPVIIEL